MVMGECRAPGRDEAEVENACETSAWCEQEQKVGREFEGRERRERESEGKRERERESAKDRACAMRLNRNEAMTIRPVIMVAMMMATINQDSFAGRSR
jgi:hypothetical protein